MLKPLSHSNFGRVLCPDEVWLARAPREDPIEPELAVVDAHMHLWHFDGCEPYFIEEYASDLLASGHNVEATVFVECDAIYRARGPEHLKCVGETEFAVGMAAIADSGTYTSPRGGRDRGVR